MPRSAAISRRRAYDRRGTYFDLLAITFMRLCHVPDLAGTRLYLVPTRRSVRAVFGIAGTTPSLGLGCPSSYWLLCVVAPGCQGSTWVDRVAAWP